MSATEHILLESDVRDVPHLQSARKAHARLGLDSRLRRRAVQLEIIDYYYLSVRSWRSRTLLAEYVLDLWFVDAKPRLSRHVAWRWMTGALTLFVLTWAIAARVGPFGSRALENHWLTLCITASGAAAVTVLTCAYRTNETIALYSGIGRAKLLEFTGGIGTLRAARTFLTKLAAHTQLATAARRASKAEHLRDEMREHFRLKEIGMLSLEGYEQAKARILGQHGQ